VLKVLYVSHNHPTIRPGGLERYADELYRAVDATGQGEAILAVKIGPPHSSDAPREGTRFSVADGDPRFHYVYTDKSEFDRIFGTARSKRLYIEDWRSFLQIHRPEVVHFHHCAWLGYDMLRETRRTLPGGAIVFTLHDFGAICHHNGQMVRTQTRQLCYEASARRCNECFPATSPQTFFLRERFVKSAFEAVDLFIAPSAFLRDRYIAWGIPPDRIVREDYGRIPVEPIPEPPGAGRRRRIGFFGQMTEFKGVEVVLEAMSILKARGVEVSLLLGGANLEIQRPGFQARIAALLDDTAECVRYMGPYAHSELPALMSSVDWVVVPSTWWENAPLIIQEAMMHRRPVICSDIGGMAERVADGVNGLHFRARDPHSLADTIQRAVETPALWDQLRGAMIDPHPMSEHVIRIIDTYRSLLERIDRPVPALASGTAAGRD
jgi:glycosyltransferase involved in cell wall biosynthesis